MQWLQQEQMRTAAAKMTANNQQSCEPQHANNRNSNN